MSREEAAAAGHFTTMQVRGGRVQGLALHLDRLEAASLEFYGVDHGKAALKTRIREALVAVVVAALGVVTGSNVPSSVEAARLNLYRWTFVVSVLTWVVLGWAAAALALRRGVRSPLGVGPVAGRSSTGGAGTCPRLRRA